MRRYVHGPGVDEPLVWYEGSGLSDRRYLVTDYQGSIIAENGASTVRYAYGPYGEPDSWIGARFRYTGQSALPEVQLYHYKARVYDPVLGRFLQTDPVGYEDDLNLYAYVRNDPLNNSDPTGRQCAGGDGRAACLVSQRHDAPREAAIREAGEQRGAEVAAATVGTAAAVAATIVRPVPGDEAAAIGTVGANAARSSRARELMEGVAQEVMMAAVDAAGPQPSAPQPYGDGLTLADVDAMARPPETSGTLDSRGK